MIEQNKPKIDGWETGRLIGKGSFGAVYEIHRVKSGLEEKAALKAIYIPQNDSERAQQRRLGKSVEGVNAYFQDIVSELQKEIAIMSEVDGYTNIVSYKDHSENVYLDEKGQKTWELLIRMELLTSLDDYFYENPVTEEQVIQLGTDLCRALEICEKHQIIHRDVKPANTFVNKDGDFKLGDFGIARTAEKSTSGMSKKGTYDYMAPEVYSERPYGKTVDLYSLGIMLYSYLNRMRPPFIDAYADPSSTDFEWAREQRMSGATPAEPLNGSPQLKQVVMKAISFVPADRYQSAKDFRQALERCVDFIQDAAKDLRPAATGAAPGGNNGTSGGTTGEVFLGGDSFGNRGTSGGTVGGTMGGTIEGTAGGTTFGEKEHSDLKPEKSVPWKWIVIGTVSVVAVVFIGGAVWNMTKKKPEPLPASSISEPASSESEVGSESVPESEVTAAGALIYGVEGGGTLSTSSASGLEELRLESGEETNVTAVPDEGYEFSGWDDGVTDNPRKDETSEEDTIITAIFKKSDSSVAPDPTPDPTYYTATYSVSGSGTLKSGKTSGKTKLSLTVEEGKSVSVTAVPSANYHFVRWSDGSTNATRTDKNITSNLNITAVFEANPDPEPVPTPTPEPTKYTVQYTASGQGSIRDAKGNPHSTLSYTVTSSDAVSVAAVAASGYHFVKWSDGNTSATRTDSGFSQDKTYTATFEQDAPSPSPTTVTWDYGDYGGGIVIYGYSGSSSVSSLRIPSTINGKTVVKIDKYAFVGRSEVRSVSIPSSVTEIGSHAFYDTHITSVTISASCSVCDNAFPSNCTVTRQ